MAFGKMGNVLGKWFDMNDDVDDDLSADEVEQPEQTAAPRETHSKGPSRPVASANGNSAYRSNNVVAMNTPAPKGAKIELYEPRIYSDAKEIGRNLLSNTAVLVNFTHLEDEDAKRIVDFLTGVVFAINGEIKRVGDQIFLVTPANFEVSGALAGKLQDDFNTNSAN
ncbi:cell division protein SepF [Lacticaseibacillus zhaodongensis]|uniref:cell division protein SepF n=1 Tax=Lacticaseibacillus zhaodongensis TaxID=2668065 RepID=UPI0012D34E04|nr:cell division protein SepF [Lacticaseibacillus zhaodongensis]